MNEELPMISREELIQDVREAIGQKKAFAMGKIGFSEQCLLGFLPFLNSNPPKIKIKAYEAMLKYHCEIQIGIFPTTTTFLKEFASFYLEQVRKINILGVFLAEQEPELIKNTKIQSKLIPFHLTEPDRSIPSDSENCYLPYLKDKKILFISPFAELLKSRAEKDKFERVWKKTEKKWFFPMDCDAIEIPYSFGTSTQTHQDYGDSLALLKKICAEIETRDFDVALIAAGALALPIAAHIKKIGKIGISLGGHLQVLFGINGGRWKNDDFWVENYINDSWIDMPLKYHPPNMSNLADQGAYW